MKTFSQFIAEAYDKDVMGSSQIRRTGEGGRIDPRTRKKSGAESRRLKQTNKSGEERKPTEYKPRKDIGSQKSRSEREQQPTQERGSSDVKAKAAAAAKEERKKAALARIAAKKAGGSAPAASKPKAKEASATATKLLSTKKKTDVDKRPADQPKRPVVGMSRKERQEITRKGQRKLKDLVKQSEAEKQKIPASKVKLKHDYTTW